jgi:hypothetical protein
VCAVVILRWRIVITGLATRSAARRSDCAQPRSVGSHVGTPKPLGHGLPG